MASPWTLSQREAYATAVDRSASCVFVGAAGMGKTSSLFYISRALQSMGKRVKTVQESDWKQWEVEQGDQVFIHHHMGTLHYFKMPEALKGKQILIETRLAPPDVRQGLSRAGFQFIDFKTRPYIPPSTPSPKKKPKIKTLKPLEPQEAPPQAPSPRKKPRTKTIEPPPSPRKKPRTKSLETRPKPLENLLTQSPGEVDSN